MGEITPEDIAAHVLIGDALTSRRLTQQQLADKTGLPIDRVVQLLGSDCGTGGMYFRQEYKGVVRWGLDQENLRVRPPATGQIQGPAAEPAAQPRELLTAQQKYDLFTLLRQMGVPPIVIQAVTQDNYGQIIKYVTDQRQLLAQQLEAVRERAKQLGRLEEMLKAVK